MNGTRLGLEEGLPRPGIGTWEEGEEEKTKGTGKYEVQRTALYEDTT